MLDKTQIDEVPIKSRKILPKIIFLLCVIGFAVIGLLVFSADAPSTSYFHRGNYFWYRLAWFELIFATFWYAFRGMHIKKMLQKRQQTGATQVIVSFLFFKLSLYSFAVWGIGAFAPDTHPWNVIPVAVQVLLLLYYGILLYFFPQTQALQTQGQDIIPSDLPTPDQLAELIKECEQGDVADKAKENLKELREKIKYSLPRVGKIALSSTYADLVVQTKQLIEVVKTKKCDEISLCENNVWQLLSHLINECKN